MIFLYWLVFGIAWSVLVKTGSTNNGSPIKGWHVTASFVSIFVLQMAVTKIASHIMADIIFSQPNNILYLPSKNSTEYADIFAMVLPFLTAIILPFLASLIVCIISDYQAKKNGLTLLPPAFEGHQGPIGPAVVFGKTSDKQNPQRKRIINLIIIGVVVNTFGLWLIIHYMFGGAKPPETSVILAPQNVATEPAQPSQIPEGATPYYGPLYPIQQRTDTEHQQEPPKELKPYYGPIIPLDKP